MLRQFLAAAASPLVRAANIVDYSLQSPRGQTVLPGRLYIPPEASLSSAASRPLIVWPLAASRCSSSNAATPHS